MDTTIVMISNVYKALEAFRMTVYKEMRLHHLTLFLSVCIQPGITMPEMQVRLNMPQGSVSRNANLLAYKFNLIDLQPDEFEPRRLAMFLSDHGQEVMSLIINILS